MLQEIATHVFVELDYEGANVGCVLTDAGAIVIDTPIIPEEAQHWADTVSKLTDKVLYIFNTDHHRAHIMGNQFFDAPVGLFVTTDTYLGRGSWSDAGMYLQTIMLAAKGFGLDTCPQAAWIPYQTPVFKHLGIPPDQALVSGMSLGYADPNAIENTLISDREALTNVVHYRGFD